jgi:DNA replication initiation complex subunit (GINS family)
MGDDLITYQKIREIQRDERSNTTLCKFPENILELIQSYLNEKKNFLEKNSDEKNIFSMDKFSRAEYEFKNTKISIQNIFDTRHKKIIEKAFQISKNNMKIKDTTNMLYFEKNIFMQLIELFDKYNNDCIIAMLSNKKPEFEFSCQKPNNEGQSLKIDEDFLNKEKDKKLIKIINNVPLFVWEDNSKFGPYKPEDVVFLPQKISELLVKQKMAQEVK